MTPDLILFQSYLFICYIMNTYEIFSHAIYSNIINMDYVKHVSNKNYELLYIYAIAYIILKNSQYMYNLTLYIFNYVNNNNIKSNRFDFMKIKKNKVIY